MTIGAVCGLPELAVTEAGGLKALVRLKAAAPATPATVAETVYDPPPIPFAVAFTPAMPAAVVVTVEDERMAFALAPLAAKVTVAPPTGLPPASRTVTCKIAGKAVLIGVV